MLNANIFSKQRNAVQLLEIAAMCGLSPVLWRDGCTFDVLRHHAIDKSGDRGPKWNFQNISVLTPSGPKWKYLYLILLAGLSVGVITMLITNILNQTIFLMPSCIKFDVLAQMLKTKKRKSALQQVIKELMCSRQSRALDVVEYVLLPLYSLFSIYFNTAFWHSLR